jgi:hypothetical protein
MGLSGGSKSYSGSAQKWAQPFASSAAGSVQSAFNQAQPQNQATAQGINSLIPGITQEFTGWAPQTDAAQGYYGDVIGGKYLAPSTNPGLASVLDRTRRDVTGSVNSNWAGAGRYGSFGHGEALTRGLADSEGAILSDAYNRERAIQDNAASMPAQIQNQSLAQLLQAAGVGAELPFVGTNALSGGLGSLFSGGTQKQSQGIGGILQGAGSLASSAAMFSDRRLKSNIVKIDEMTDGLGVYEYDIFGERQRGVMADEVEALRPWALGPEVEGYKTVNYGAL